MTTWPPACWTLVQNGSFEIPSTIHAWSWDTPDLPGVEFSRDDRNAHYGSGSARISSLTVNDAYFEQEVSVEPETQYLLTGWIKTENVASGTGATLSLIGTWSHSEGRFGTTDWTRVVLWFNSGANTKVTIGGRLGYSWYPSSGTAWFDDVRLTPIRPDGSRPGWKILVLIYGKTDAIVKGADGVSHHYVGATPQDEIDRATLAATQFVKTDIPALTSGNMIPELTIRYPDHPLTSLDPQGEGWWPSPAITAADRDPAFDSVIVIWDPRVVDEYTGTNHWIAGHAVGLASYRSADQTYATLIVEAANFGHRNIFKHEWGHSILFYFEALGVEPAPVVDVHASSDQYVHWPSGESYVWLDETDANPIPNSIYNNESGFTHDYYSGTIATADQPARRLGITPEAWMWGGPVTKPGILSSPPPTITCSGDITVSRNPGTCWASVPLIPPTVSGACEDPVARRSDGLPLWAPFPCGQTIVTWTAANNDDQVSTCQQVVTVTDDEPPVFVNTPPPISVTTGPEATSCGVVVEDSRLGVTGANPVVHDAIVDLPSPAYPNNVVSMSATYDRDSLTFTVNFADKILPASSGSVVYGLTGYIDIDADQNLATGQGSALDFINHVSTKLGVDFTIDLLSEYGHPGFVDVKAIQQAGSSIISTVPIVFTSTSFSVTVPLATLGPDDGLVNYGVAIFSISQYPDRVPDDAEPATSVNISEVGVLDNCTGVTISRSGVPANNVFPVGQTLITYTATDNAGNETSVTQTVTVIDNTSPVISNPAASPSTLWPPNGEMVDVTVSYQATDNCGILGTKLIVSSNDPDAADWEVLDAHRVRLRAKRTARLGARLYTITIIAEDVHGNLSRQNVIVTVPHNNGKGG